MRKILVFVILTVFVCGCVSNGSNTGETNSSEGTWTLYIISGNSVKELSLEDPKKLGLTDMPVPDLALGRTVHWEGIPPQKLGKGDVINFISENGEIVSVPSNVSMVLALYRDGEPVNGTVRLITSLSFGCKCHWIDRIKVVEFLNESSALHIYGMVENELYLSPRTLGIFEGIDYIVKHEKSKAGLKDIINLADPWPEAKEVTFVTSRGEKTFRLSDVIEKNPTIEFENGFCVPELNICGIKGIRIGGD
ncbi:hypothetical protein [Pyrococcus yayanosii]|uniref:Lipoprotein n=1 Tax=Pyrococcus yayanosii (strain CH1 / JCM 16557) TaxID=529709 RepID=F8AFP4_PYRYC|nr:hypothetical protein [Pyrococcus yayanosii]AEH25019.1 hypothetical protein PYCH_13470 [Pyrococcus yayanosii CH1]